MKNFGKIAVVLIVVGSITSITGGYIKLWISLAGLFVLITGVAMFVYWSTYKYKWKCSKCEKEFKISIIQNITGLNMG